MPALSKDFCIILPDRVKELDAMIEKFLTVTKAVVPQRNPAFNPQAAMGINRSKIPTGMTKP
jgi:hypothetical protein